MGSPIQVGDVVLLLNLAWDVHQGFKYAPGELKALSTQALSIHSLLHEIEESFEELHLFPHQRDFLRQLISQCKKVLEDVKKIIKRYECICSGKAKLKRLRYLLDEDKIQQVKQQLMDQVNLLTTFNSTIAM